MRTPGAEVAHGAGFCLAEGIVDGPEDFKTLGYDPDLAPNIIDIWLTRAHTRKVAPLLERKGYISQTSCGICGKQMIQDLNQILVPSDSPFSLELDQIFYSIGQLSKNQHIYPRTRGSHAALLFDSDLEILAFAEDVGRHNALDKAVGKAFMEKKLSLASLLVMSSRISYELVQKAARAKIPMIVSKSRPTALAVKMGRSLNMTLVCAFGKSELIVVCGEQRILAQTKAK
jgi:FdhD protein